MTSPAARRSPYARLIADDDGSPRTGPILLLLALAIVVLAVGTFAGLVAGSAGRPEVLGAWVLAGFILVKVPLLATVWWILGRRREPPRAGGWSSRECGEILEYLEREARAAIGRPDQDARLAYFAREAWFVADSAADADKAAAVAAAVRIEALAAERAGGGREPGTG